MKNILPKFIIDRLNHGKYSGSLEASVLFLDISGFTRITEELMTRGSEGAEILSDLLEEIYDPLVDIVYSYGGSIAGFEGDSFTAVFEEKENESTALRMLRAGAEMKEMISSSQRLTDINAKICIAEGDLGWHIFRHDRFYHYYFFGSALEKVYRLAKHAGRGNILADQGMLKRLKGFIEYSALRRSSGVLRILGIKPFSVSKDKYRVRPLSRKCLSGFYPDEVINFPKGEFRDITTVFISFDFTQASIDMLKAIVKYQEYYGGSTPRFISGDKGNCILVFFGSPVSYEDNEMRAVNFIKSIRQAVFNKSRIGCGMTTGVVFAGFYGSKARSDFSCLGTKVNLASRLMVMCPSDRVYMDEETSKRIRRHFASKFVAEEKVKGFKKMIGVYRLSEKGIDTEDHHISVFVGREAELRRLRSNVMRTLDGKLKKISMITGGTGAGKSRLLSALKESLDRGIKWVEMVCSSLDRLPFHPLISLLEEHFRQMPGQDEKEKKQSFLRIYDELINADSNIELRDEILRSKPFIAFLLDIDIQRDDILGLDANIRHESILNSLKVFLVSQARGDPFVLCIDNSHLLDADTLQFLNFFLGSAGDCRFALIFSGRGSINDKYLRNRIVEIRLKGLNRRSSRKLIENIISSECSEEAIDHIYSRSEGNPLFLLALASYIKENELLDADNKLKKGNLEIPGSIQSIILSQIDKLSRALKKSVRNASVLGYRFEAGILLSMIARQKIGDKKVLKQGTSKNIWKPASLLIYMFSNSLIRDTVYQIQLKRELKRLHGIAADSYISTYKDNPAYYYDIARHLEISEKYRDAIQYYKKASEYYLNGISAREALNCYKKVLELLIFIRADETEILMAINENMQLMRFIGLFKEGILLYRDFISIMEKAENLEILCDILINTAYFYNITNEVEKGENLIEKALEIASKKQDKKMLSIIYHSRAVNLLFRHEVDEALACFNMSAELKKIRPDDANLSVIYFYRGEFDKAKKHLDRYYTIAKKSGKKYALIQFLELSARYYMTAEKDFKKALSQIDKAQKLLNEFYFRYAEIKLVFTKIEIYYKLGKYDKAMELSILAEKEAIEMNYVEGICYSGFMTGILSLIKRDYASAEKYLKKYQKMSVKAEINDYVYECLIYRTLLCGLKGMYMKGSRFLNTTIAFMREKNYDPALIEELDLLKIIFYNLDRGGGLSGLEKGRGLLSCIETDANIRAIAEFFVFRRYEDIAGGEKPALVEKYQRLRLDSSGPLYDVLLSYLK